MKKLQKKGPETDRMYRKMKYMEKLSDLRIQKHKQINAKLEAKFRKLGEFVREVQAKLKQIEPLLQTSNNSGEDYRISAERGDELVKNFLEQLDTNVRNNMTYSDFNLFYEDLKTDGKGALVLPLSLAPIAERIKHTYGDITLNCLLGKCASQPSYIMFCAAIKEMDDLKLEQVNESKMLLWRNAINVAMAFRLKVSFAKEQLKKIARAYFGLKAMNEELVNIDGTLWKIKVPEDCLREAKYFRGRPLSTGLFPTIAIV